MKKTISYLSLAGFLVFSATAGASLRDCKLEKVLAKKRSFKSLKGLLVRTKCRRRVKGVTAEVYLVRSPRVQPKRVAIINNVSFYNDYPRSTNKWIRFRLSAAAINASGNRLKLVLRKGRTRLYAWAKLVPIELRIEGKPYYSVRRGALARDCKISSMRRRSSIGSSPVLRFHFSSRCKKVHTVDVRFSRIISSRRRSTVAVRRGANLKKGRGGVSINNNYPSKNVRGGAIETALTSRRGEITVRQKVVGYRWKLIPVKHRDHRRIPLKRR